MIARRLLECLIIVAREQFAEFWTPNSGFRAPDSDFNIEGTLNSFMKHEQDEPEQYMSVALALARESGEEGETPVGCVIVDAAGAIIGSGRNRRENAKSAVAHAEIEAIDDACKSLGDWRLSGCSLYVTLEPCPMCAGAIIMSRIDKVFFGAQDGLTGSCGSVINIFMEPYGHSTQITGGILADDCSDLITGFFRMLRST